MDNFDLKKYLAEGRLFENEYFDVYHEAGDKLENHPNYNKLVSILKDKGFEPDGNPYSDGTGRRDVHGVWDVFKSYTTEPGARGTTLTKANAKDINDALRQAGIEDIKATPSNSYSFRLKVNNLAEGRLFEEDFKNPILDKYLKLKKSIDYKTVFPTDLQSFVDSLDNTEREGLESDLAEGKLLKENIDMATILSHDDYHELYIGNRAEHDASSEEEQFSDEYMIDLKPGMYHMIFWNDEGPDYNVYDSKEEYVKDAIGDFWGEDHFESKFGLTDELDAAGDNWESVFHKHIEDNIDMYYEELNKLTNNSEADGDSAKGVVLLQNGKVVAGEATDIRTKFD